MATMGHGKQAVAPGIARALAGHWRGGLGGRVPSALVPWLVSAAALAAPCCKLVAEPVSAGLANAIGGDGGVAGATIAPATGGIVIVQPDAGPDQLEVCGEGTSGRKPDPATVTILMLVDRSFRMTQPPNKAPWPALKQALYGLFRAPPPPALPLSVGLSFFPVAEAEGNAASLVSTYTSPQVPFALLTSADAPVDAQELELIGQVVEATPETDSQIGAPTVQAFRGSLGYALEHAAERPDERVAILLVTGGVPTAPFCPPAGAYDPDNPTPCLDPVDSGTAPDLVQALVDSARAGFKSSAAVRTFAIVVGEALGPKVEIAKVADAGGGRCFNCDPTVVAEDDATLADSIFGYLEELAENEFACQYSVALPESASEFEVDYQLVNVRYRDAASEWGWLKNVDRSECGPNGWYFDDPGSPRFIVFCDDVCSAIRRFAEPEIEVVYGCAAPIR